MIKTNSYKINNFDISKLTVIEIKKIAKEKGISGISKLKKKDLIKITRLYDIYLFDCS